MVRLVLRAMKSEGLIAPTGKGARGQVGRRWRHYKARRRNTAPCDESVMHNAQSKNYGA